MVTLPREPSRRELRSFWTVASAAAGLVAAWLAPAEGPVAVSVGVAAAAAMGLPGWLRPRAVEPVQSGWNRAADLAGRAAARWVSTVTFFVLVTVVSLAGSRMPWRGAEPGGSGWTPRLDRDLPHAAQHHGAGRPDAEGPWVRSLGRWALDSGNLWAVGLVPLLALLRLLRPRAARSLGENIYTLY